MTLPEELRKELGNYITLKKTPQGYLMLPAKQAKQTSKNYKK